MCIVRNVLVVNDKQLLGAAIKNLLRGAKGVHLFGLTAGCVFDLIEVIYQMSPDVLILDSSLYWETILLTTLARSKGMSTLNIIVVDASHNTLTINGILSIPVTTTYDLVNIVCNTQATSGFQSIIEQKFRNTFQLIKESQSDTEGYPFNKSLFSQCNTAPNSLTVSLL